MRKNKDQLQHAIDEARRLSELLARANPRGMGSAVEVEGEFVSLTDLRAPFGTSEPSDTKLNLQRDPQGG
jgi:hypothetical protein